MSQALDKAREVVQARKAAGLKARKSPLEKLQDNPTSLRLAINGMCYVCEGEDADPGVRQRIAECGITRCPLHAVRPYQKLSKVKSHG